MATSRERDPGPSTLNDGKAELAARVADAGFTPSVKRLGELLDLFAHEDDELAKHAERAVFRIEAQYAERVAKESVARARSAVRPARGRLTHLAGRLAQDKRDPEGLAHAWLIDALSDADPKTRRAAARGLGKLPPTKEIEDALTKAFDAAASDDDKRAFALALGKTGGEGAASRLATGAHGRAALIVSRERARRTSSEIDTARAPAAPVRIWFHTRSGLEDILKDELGIGFGKPRFLSPGVVEASLAGPLSEALSIRTATDVGFALDPVTQTGDIPADIVRAICSPEAIAILRGFTSSDSTAPVRFRLVFTRGGHRRGDVWRTAELVQAATRELINDPTESTWEVVVDDVGDKVKVELVPRAYVDDRFAYRQDMVAASSHPAIAAALARVAPRSDGDIVWDPFAGAGAELVERARLGPYSRLVGTDTDSRAIAAARANLKRAGVDGHASLEIADANTHVPSGVNLIITNPPMGRRVQRGTHADLLERFVAHAAEVLAPGGALVWLVPEPRSIRECAESAGLVLERALSVDMGGFSAELQIFLKKADKKPRRIVDTTPAPEPPRQPPRKKRPRLAE